MEVKIAAQQKILDYFNKILGNNVVFHAYFFYGNEGVGKKTLARFLAKSILCIGVNKPCGVCNSCRKFSNSTHPDYVELGDELGVKQSFSIKEARGMLEQAFFMANDGEYKIFLLKDVDTLLPSAANSLLKLIESPPDNVVFLLTANNKHKALPTIVSRCIQIFVGQASRLECEVYFKSLSLNGSSKDIINLSQGSIGKLIFYANTEEGKLIFNISEKLKLAYINNNEFLFLYTLQRVEKDVVLVLKILDCLLAQFLLLLECNINKHNSLKDTNISKFCSVLNNILNAIKALKSMGNVAICISKLCCDIFG